MMAAYKPGALTLSSLQLKHLEPILQSNQKLSQQVKELKVCFASKLLCRLLDLCLWPLTATFDFDGLLQDNSERDAGQGRKTLSSDSKMPASQRSSQSKAKDRPKSHSDKHTLETSETPLQGADRGLKNGNEREEAAAVTLQSHWRKQLAQKEKQRRLEAKSSREHAVTQVQAGKILDTVAQTRALEKLITNCRRVDLPLTLTHPCAALRSHVVRKNLLDDRTESESIAPNKRQHDPVRRKNDQPTQSTETKAVDDDISIGSRKSQSSIASATSGSSFLGKVFRKSKHGKA